MSFWSEKLIWVHFVVASSFVVVCALAGPVRAQAHEITFADAQRIALEHVPGTVESIERDHEAGVVVFEVEIVDADGAEHEVVIDAADGRVIQVEDDD